MGRPVASLLLAAGLAKSILAADQAMYAQCGGNGWTESTTCVTGSTCVVQNEWYYQCVPSALVAPVVNTPPSNGQGSSASVGPCPGSANTPGAASTAASHAPASTSAGAPAGIPSAAPAGGVSDGAVASSPVWGQCGGMGWTGPTTCDPGSTCVFSNPYYSQCLPGTSVPGSTSAAPSTTSKPASTTAPASTTKSSTSAGAQPTGGSSKFRVGVNIAGLDFGCSTDGTCGSGTNGAYPPIKNFTGSNNYPDGIGQMTHFVNDDNFSFFRLPFGWEYMVNNVLGGTLDETFASALDQLVEAATSQGAWAILDLHNYARWKGNIVGQSSTVTDDDLASIWVQLAKRYMNNGNVLLGLMNEPQGVDITRWAQTLQAVVTAVRGTGFKGMISLPGNDWQSAGAFLTDGSADALVKITNPDGSTDNLIMDFHKYLDSDNSGTSTECTTNNIDVFTQVASWLRQHNRKAIITETGGGNTASCLTMYCQQVQFLAANSDVFLGITEWAAGSFLPDYALSATPTQNGNIWVDQPLVKSCMVPVAKGQ